jgi:hypothetical protein
MRRDGGLSLFAHKNMSIEKRVAGVLQRGLWVSALGICCCRLRRLPPQADETGAVFRTQNVLRIRSDLLEHILARTAQGAVPVIRYVFECRARGDAAVGIANSRIVDILTDRASPFLHHFPPHEFVCRSFPGRLIRIKYFPHG